MYHPNDIGPWPCADIEKVPWNPGTTLRGLIDDIVLPLIGAGVRSVAAPAETNYENFVSMGGTMTPTGTDSCWAVGCLINGTNPDPTNNIIYTISGSAFMGGNTTNDFIQIFPVISKLDATPSDPDALITLTDWYMLPMNQYSQAPGQIGGYASVNTQVVVGNIAGVTAAQSNLPIFVGWAFQSFYSSAYTMYLNGNINVHKYLGPIQTQDWRSQ